MWSGWLKAYSLLPLSKWPHPSSPRSIMRGLLASPLSGPLVAASRNRNETIVCASNYVHGAIGSHSLACFDLGQAEAARVELSRRFGNDASWQLVFVSNARSIYEVVPAGGFYTLPPYYVLEAMANATQSALPRLGQLVFSSRLAAALVGRELMRIGLDSVQATLSVLSPNDATRAASPPLRQVPLRRGTMKLKLTQNG